MRRTHYGGREGNHAYTHIHIHTHTHSYAHHAHVQGTHYGGREGNHAYTHIHTYTHIMHICRGLTTEDVKRIMQKRAKKNPEQK